MKSRRMLRFKSMISILICAVLALGLSSGVACGMELGPTGLSLSGEAEQTVNWFLTEGELSLGITRYKLSLDQDLRRAGAGIDGHAHVSVKGWYNHKASEGKWLELDEAYADIYHDLFDLRLGQQLVSWGTAYGFNPTSYVNPLPSMATLTQGGLTELTGLPVPAVYVSAYPSWKHMSADVGMVLVLNPRLQGVPLPEEYHAEILGGIGYGVQAGLQAPGAAEALAGAMLPLLPPEMSGIPGIEVQLAESIRNAEVRLTSPEFSAKPPNSFTDRLELAGRAGMNFGMWDLYLSGFRGWEDTPVLWVETVPSMEVVPAVPIPQLDVYMDIYPKAAYRKATALGAAASGTWGPYTFWGEGSYTWPDKVKELDAEGNIAMSTNDPYLRAVVGADRMFGSASEYYVMGQYMYNGSGSLLSPYRMPGEKAKAGHYLAAVGRATIHDDHQIELMNICNLRDKSGLIVPRYTYKVNPMLSAWIGTTFLLGEEATEFGNLSISKSVFAGAKVVW
ncbi:MAG TPA: DUF1302 domain-containing protein [Firmicutes bacterium]|jgi:hypothetical protein|nr:DUF1302 domain-containing protein [Bacillota bacterium]